MLVAVAASRSRPREMPAAASAESGDRRAGVPTSSRRSAIRELCLSVPALCGRLSPLATPFRVDDAACAPTFGVVVRSDMSKGRAARIVALQLATLGRTGELVSVMGFGAAALVDQPAKAAGAVLGAALDLGITLIDTAPDYGATEELIGSHLAHRRNEFFLATKCGCPASVTTDDHDFSRANIRRCVDDSLRRTRSDHLDLVQFHASPSRNELILHESVDELVDLKAEGKVRFIGYSGSGQHLAENLASDAFDAFQIPFSMLEPEHEALVSEAGDRGAGVLLRGGVGRGVELTGEQIAALPSTWHSFLRARSAKWEGARLQDILEGESPTSLMIRFSLATTGVTSVLVGTANTRHLDENVHAAGRGPLPNDVFAEIRERLGF